MVTRSPQEAAQRIWAARQAGRTLDAEATGESMVGWRLGFNWEVMRYQMGTNRLRIRQGSERHNQGHHTSVCKQSLVRDALTSE